MAKRGTHPKTRVVLPEGAMAAMDVYRSLGIGVYAIKGWRDKGVEIPEPTRSPDDRRVKYFTAKQQEALTQQIAEIRSGKYSQVRPRTAPRIGRRKASMVTWLRLEDAVTLTGIDAVQIKGWVQAGKIEVKYPLHPDLYVRHAQLRVQAAIFRGEAVERPTVAERIAAEDGGTR